MSEEIKKLLEALIRLVGRLAYKEEEIIKIIGKKKRDAKKYFLAYNLCNGENDLSTIAKRVKVDAGNLSRIFTKWEELGIIYDSGKKGGKYYRHIFPIQVKLKNKTGKETVQETKEELTKTENSSTS